LKKVRRCQVLKVVISGADLKEGALDEVASVGGDISAGRAVSEAGMVAVVLGCSLHSQGIICWWALGVAFKVPITYAT
jgi:hypothetical protein